MYCETCKMSVEGEERCPVCGRTLIDYTPILDDDDMQDLNTVFDGNADKVAENDENAAPTVEQVIDGTEPQLLVTTAESDSEEIISLLNVNLIPALVKPNEEFTGESGENMVDVFVPAELMPQAMELLNDIIAADDEEMSDEELDELLMSMVDESDVDESEL